MPKGPEAKVEAYLVEQVEARGALTRKLKWIGRRGAADRLVVWPVAQRLDHMGFFHYAPAVDFVEVKAEDKMPEDLQEREINRLRALGAAVFIVDSREAVDAYVKGRI